MLDTTNPDVLSYLRREGGSTVVVAINFAAAAKTVTLDVPGKTVKTLATDDPALRAASSLKNVTIAPFSSWVASVQ